MIGGDQGWSAIRVPIFCMAGAAFQLFEEPENVGEQTPNIILEVGSRCSTSKKILAVSPPEEPPLSRTLLELYKRPCRDFPGLS